MLVAKKKKKEEARSTLDRKRLGCKGCVCVMAFNQGQRAGLRAGSRTQEARRRKQKRSAGGLYGMYNVSQQI